MMLKRNLDFDYSELTLPNDDEVPLLEYGEKSKSKLMRKLMIKFRKKKKKEKTLNETGLKHEECKLETVNDEKNEDLQNSWLIPEEKTAIKATIRESLQEAMDITDALERKKGNETYHLKLIH